MKAVFVAILFLVSGSIPLRAETAYQVLRNNFRLSHVPDPAELHLGQSWYCSGQLAAAKGLFQMVPVWEWTYQFVLQPQGYLINHGSRKAPEFAYDEHSLIGPSSCTNCEKVMDSIRISNRGHLLVEVTQPLGDQATERAISWPRLAVRRYLTCENPASHAGDRWFGDSNLWNF